MTFIVEMVIIYYNYNYENYYRCPWQDTKIMGITSSPIKYEIGDNVLNKRAIKLIQYSLTLLKIGSIMLFKFSSRRKFILRCPNTQSSSVNFKMYGWDCVGH